MAVEYKYHYSSFFGLLPSGFYFNDTRNDFVSNSKEILKFLDLKWEDKIKNYNKNIRPVTTASFQQVREGIKKNTSMAWKKYSNYLNPMQDTLKNMKIKF